MAVTKIRAQTKKIKYRIAPLILSPCFKTHKNAHEPQTTKHQETTMTVIEKRENRIRGRE